MNEKDRITEEGHSMSNNDTFEMQPWGYREAVYILARWKFEAETSELVEPHRYERYSERYFTGFDMVKIVTQKSYEEINCDINLVYNKAYGSTAREGVKIRSCKSCIKSQYNKRAEREQEERKEV